MAICDGLFLLSGLHWSGLIPANGHKRTYFLSGFRGNSSALILLGLLYAAATPAFASPPVLNSTTDIATAGYYQLSWKPDTALSATEEYELQVSNDATFGSPRIQYRGPDRATVVSGQGDGERHYRVRTVRASGEAGIWSEPVSVTVDHHPLYRALWFFLAGAIVFIATLAVVVRGAPHEAPESD